MSDELVPEDLTADDARKLLDEIKTALEMTWELVQDAYAGRAWIALGYSSWEDCCEKEFPRFQLSRGDRPEVISSLRASGMSTRAIAAATGLGKGTIGRELSGAPNGAPETIIGTDGKSYRAERLAPEWDEELRKGIDALAEDQAKRLATIEALPIEKIESVSVLEGILDEVGRMPREWDAARARLREAMEHMDRRIEELS